MDASSVEATREIMWNIPKSFKIAMYSLFILSLIIMLRGIYQKLKYVTGNKPLKKRPRFSSGIDR